MPDQPATSARIEDLKARVRLDPKSRHFYPLAEELRKFRRLDDAEKVLRDGLEHHGTYLSAWVSLGRVLQEKNDHRAAIDPLMKALALDPGNVVCARLLATSYLALGEKVEAIKKLKLVRALLPSDEDVEEQIQRLDREINEEKAATAPLASPSPSVSSSEPERAETSPKEEPAPGPEVPARDSAAPVAPQEPPLEAARESWGHPFSSGRDDLAEADAAPAPAVGEPSAAPEEPAAGESLPAAEAGALESPFTQESGIAEAPFGGHWSPSEEPFGASEPAAAAEPFDSAAEIEEEHVPAAAADERTATMTMGDLYARQGHAEAAKEIYNRLLDREPSSAEVRQRLEALERSQGTSETRPDRRGAVKRLEGWLDKVGRR